MTLLQYSDVILGNDNVYATNEHYSINITGLTPFTTYSFIIWANNSVGNTGTDMMNFTTDQTGMRVALYSTLLICFMYVLAHTQLLVWLLVTSKPIT